MKKYLLFIGLLILLSGCAFGVYDGREFHGAVIGAPYPYHPDGYYRASPHGHGYKYYPYPSGRYYRGYPGYYR